MKKTSKFKKSVSILLTLLMILTMLPLSAGSPAAAADGAVTEVGYEANAETVSEAESPAEQPADPPAELPEEEQPAEPPVAEEKQEDEGAKDPENSTRSIIDPQPVHTYVFKNADETEHSRQIVKNGEQVTEPVPAPTDGNKPFIGWYTAKEGGDKLTFPINASVTENKEIKVYARFSTDVYVKFIDTQNDTEKVLLTKQLPKGNKTDDTDVPLVVTQQGKAFSHWSTSKNGSAFDFNTTINNDITLYLVLKDEIGRAHV